MHMSLFDERGIYTVHHRQCLKTAALTSRSAWLKILMQQLDLGFSSSFLSCCFSMKLRIASCRRYANDSLHVMRWYAYIIVLNVVSRLG